jgi:uncharacterized protein YjbI with pentapeptide repeats
MDVQPYTGTWNPENFSGKEFIRVDFSGRCLVGADFSNSVCKDCDFSDSDLSMANFRNADLYRCNFSRAVLYAVNLDDANLTRADFNGAFTYGWLLNASANVTYANMLHFALEERRRSVSFSEGTSVSAATVSFGDRIQPTRDLCRRTYQVAGYRFTFDDLDHQESALQRSQIFNRMKRLYRENHNGQAALYCQYFERYYLTRSYYKYSVLTGGKYRDQIFRTVLRTGAAYTAEFLSGYGVRPLRILRNLFVLWLVFSLLTLWVCTTARDSGVVFEQTSVTSSRTGPGPATVTVTERLVDLGKPRADIPQLLRYTTLSLVTPDSNRYTPYGMMSAFALVYFGMSACLLALLFSSVFLRLLSE